MELIAKFTVLLLAALVLLKLIRQLTSAFQLDEKTGQYFRTSGLRTDNHVKTSKIVDDFEIEYGSRTYKRFDDKSFTAPSLYVYAKCKELIEEAINFELHVDSNDCLNLNLSTNAKTVEHPIDVSNYEEKAGGPNRCHIQKVIITSSSSSIILRGLDIGEIVVGHRFEGFLFIVESRVRVLRLNTCVGISPPTLNLTNTWLGSLQVYPSSCKDFSVKGGGICHMHTGSNGNVSNPKDQTFTGNVTFEKNPPLYCLGGFSSNDLQSYRNVVNQLRQLGNIDAEKYVQAFVKRLERPSQQIFMRLISYLYDMTSFYGTSPGRAFVWLASLTSFSVFAIALSSANTSATSCENIQYWQSLMCQDSHASQIMRASYLSLESVVKPFNLMTAKSLVTTDSILIVCWITLQSFVSLVLIALIIIGVRRKFIS